MRRVVRILPGKQTDIHATRVFVEGNGGNPDIAWLSRLRWRWKVLDVIRTDLMILYYECHCLPHSSN